MRSLWKIFVFFTWAGLPLQWNHFEKYLHFSLGQVTYYNEITLKNLCIFHLGRLPLQWDHFEKSLHFSSGQVAYYNETIWKNLCILHLGGHPWQFDQFKNLWILPTDKLSGTTIPPQKKIFQFCTKIILFFTSPISFLLRFPALISQIVHFLALSLL